MMTTATTRLCAVLIVATSSTSTVFVEGSSHRGHANNQNQKHCSARRFDANAAYDDYDLTIPASTRARPRPSNKQKKNQAQTQNDDDVDFKANDEWWMDPLAMFDDEDADDVQEDRLKQQQSSWDDTMSSDEISAPWDSFGDEEDSALLEHGVHDPTTEPILEMIIHEEDDSNDDGSDNDWWNSNNKNSQKGVVVEEPPTSSGQSETRDETSNSKDMMVDMAMEMSIPDESATEGEMARGLKQPADHEQRKIPEPRQDSSTEKAEELSEHNVRPTAKEDRAAVSDKTEQSAGSELPQKKDKVPEISPRQPAPRRFAGFRNMFAQPPNTRKVSPREILEEQSQTDDNDESWRHQTGEHNNGAGNVLSALALTAASTKALVTGNTAVITMVVYAAAQTVLALLFREGFGRSNKEKKARKGSNKKEGQGEGMDDSGTTEDLYHGDGETYYYEEEGYVNEDQQQQCSSSEDLGDGDSDSSKRKGRKGGWGWFGGRSDRSQDDDEPEEDVAEVESPCWPSATAAKQKKTSLATHVHNYRNKNRDLSLDEELEELQLRLEQAEAEKQRMEKEYEATNWHLQETKSELSGLRSTTKNLQAQLADNERILKKAVKTERAKAKQELLKLKHAMVEALAKERELMQEQRDAEREREQQRQEEEDRMALQEQERQKEEKMNQQKNQEADNQRAKMEEQAAQQRLLQEEQAKKQKLMEQELAQIKKMQEREQQLRMQEQERQQQSVDPPGQTQPPPPATPPKGGFAFWRSNKGPSENSNVTASNPAVPPPPRHEMIGIKY